MVVGCARIRSCLSDIGADERLIIELEAHAISRTTLFILNGVVVWSRILITFCEVVSKGSSDFPPG